MPLRPWRLTATACGLLLTGTVFGAPGSEGTRTDDHFILNSELHWKIGEGGAR